MICRHQVSFAFECWHVDATIYYFCKVAGEIDLEATIGEEAELSDDDEDGPDDEVAAEVDVDNSGVEAEVCARQARLKYFFER